MGLGCYSPLKKRPNVPPSEFFKKNDSMNDVKQLKPRDLAQLCYGHFDGR